MIEIPLIAQDIRPDEVSIRAIKTFEYLDKAVDLIFDKIDARIAKNMTRINEINERMKKASEKIEMLKKSKKAIRMYSPARYPIENPPRIKPTFDSKSFSSMGDINFNYKLDLPLESTQFKQYSDKLSFFHLKRNRPQVPQKPNVIFNTSSINSLITFINNENLYVKDSIIQREKEIQAVDVATDDTDFNRFSSMIKNKQQTEFHYHPSFYEAPNFDFPLDLPDLQGIAGDISFSVPDSELLTPALWSMNIVNDLPNINELIEAKTNIKETSRIENIPEPPSILKDIPAPPPIPTSVSIPPPPPPPIPAAVSKEVISAPIPVDESRSSLMKAIRDAGGKSRLRTIPAADEEVPNTKKKPLQKAPAMDLMSDLHQKLSLRRKGIAGSKEAKKEKSKSMMANISSRIPPPPKKDRDVDSDDSDSTSNNDDWNE